MRQENAASWSDIPTSALRAELLRRQTADHDRPTCGRAGATSDYNMPLHVFALVLILVLSTLGKSRSYISHCFSSLTMHSMFVPNSCSTASSHARTSSIPFPVQALWHRCLDRDRLCPSSAYRLQFPHRSVPPAFLESWLSRHGWLHRHDFRHGSRSRGNVLR